jgi:hypothetical protein
MAILLLSLLCAWCFKRRQADLSRGEYRAVAAHYTANAFDDTFADDVSENGGGEYDADDLGWGDKRAIEMRKLPNDEVNGGLTLEEMNG